MLKSRIMRGKKETKWFSFVGDRIYIKSKKICRQMLELKRESKMIPIYKKNQHTEINLCISKNQKWNLIGNGYYSKNTNMQK